MSLAYLGREAGYFDAMLNRKPSASKHFIADHMGEDFAVFCTAYYSAYREVRTNQINEGTP